MNTAATMPSTSTGAVAPKESAQLGTWKLNEAKSNIPSWVHKYTDVIYEPHGDMIKCITLGTTPDGKPMRLEWTGKFDGKDYPTIGDPYSDMRSCILEDDRTMLLANKKNGKPTTSARVVISPDGKSRTIQATGVDADGKQAGYTGVYDRA